MANGYFSPINIVYVVYLCASAPIIGSNCADPMSFRRPPQRYYLILFPVPNGFHPPTPPPPPSRACINISNTYYASVEQRCVPAGGCISMAGRCCLHIICIMFACVRKSNALRSKLAGENRTQTMLYIVFAHTFEYRMDCGRCPAARIYFECYREQSFKNAVICV